VIRALLDWIDDRTGAVSAVKDFFDEEIPASAGWHQVFGSVALFLLTVQFLTGVLLAVNYAPQPETAYYSLQYIVNEVTAGRLMRGLHHWGATVMIVIVVLHMVQAAIWGAYKKPREMTWVAGVLLLLLTMAFGLTGYLLPWDNKAYWATVVTLQISALPPVAGDLTLRVLGSEEGTVGAATFARFYTLHTVVLPAITAALAVFHVALVRRHGVAPQPGDESKPKKKFYPGQVFKDTAAVFAVFVVLFALAAFVEAPLGQIADPNDTAFVPRPEWYFLFLFQILKFFEGSLEIVGAVVLPTLAVLALAALPFIDRSRFQRVGERLTAMAIVAVAGLVWGVLTWAAVVTTPDQAEGPGGGDWARLTPAQLAGGLHFTERNCDSCHNVVSGEPKAGPTLALVIGARQSADWVAGHIAEHGGAPRNVREALITFAAEITPERGLWLAEAPDFGLQGAAIYEKNNCGMCHVVNGAGENLGPPLNGVGGRRDPAWLAGHFRDPQAFVPESTMPPYPFDDDEMESDRRLYDGPAVKTAYLRGALRIQPPPITTSPS
jgi:ubiquinol-cytochrome c reductase cytochrome b subunit